MTNYSQQILALLRSILEVETEIRDWLARPAGLIIQFEGETMPATGEIKPGQTTIPATFTYVDSSGNPVKGLDFAGVTVSAPDPAVATMTYDPATGVATFTRVGAGTTTGTATSAAVPGATPPIPAFTDTYTLTVDPTPPPPPAGLQMTFGAAS